MLKLQRSPSGLLSIFEWRVQTTATCWRESYLLWCRRKDVRASYPSAVCSSATFWPRHRRSEATQKLVFITAASLMWFCCVWGFTMANFWRWGRGASLNFNFFQKVWLGLGTKTTLLVLGKDHVLALNPGMSPRLVENICFCSHKESCSQTVVSNCGLSLGSCFAYRCHAATKPLLSWWKCTTQKYCTQYSCLYITYRHQSPHSRVFLKMSN